MKHVGTKFQVKHQKIPSRGMTHKPNKPINDMFSHFIYAHQQSRIKVQDTTSINI